MLKVNESTVSSPLYFCLLPTRKKKTGGTQSTGCFHINLMMEEQRELNPKSSQVVRHTQNTKNTKKNPHPSAIIQIKEYSKPTVCRLQESQGILHGRRKLQPSEESDGNSGSSAPAEAGIRDLNWWRDKNISQLRQVNERWSDYCFDLNSEIIWYSNWVDGDSETRLQINSPRQNLLWLYLMLSIYLYIIPGKFDTSEEIRVGWHTNHLYIRANGTMSFYNL